jgi:hypothetical protein
VASPNEQKWERGLLAGSVAYVVLSIVCAAMLVFAARGGRQPDVVLWPFVRPLWNAVDDPVIAFLIRAVIVIVGIALFPGVISILITFAILILACAVFLMAIYLLVLLASVSVGGAVVVFGSIIALTWWLLWAYREEAKQIIEYFHPLLDLAAAAYVWAVRPEEFDTSEYDVINYERGTKMDMPDDSTRGLRSQMTKLAEVLDLGQVPMQLEDYDGWIQEAVKRVQMRSLRRTREEALALLQQARIAVGEMLQLKRAQAELGRLPKEHSVKDLELDEQRLALELKIAQHQLAIKRLSDPSKVPQSSRSIIIDDDEDS